ncbi:MAG: TlpA family protein disulfide reductase [Gemmataceae bacterium]
MRVVYTVSLVAVGLGLLGCSSTSKNPRSPGTSSPPANINNGNQPFWAQPDNTRKSPTLNQPLGSKAELGGDGVKLTSAEQPDVNGILAGRVIDLLGRKSLRVYVQVQPAVGGGGGGARPIEVAADDSGYFLVPGLTPGRSYTLTARAQDNGKLLAGRVQALPPNPRLVIKLSEDQAGSDVPPIPSGPTLPGAERSTSFPGPRASVPSPAPPPPLPPMPNLDRNRADGEWMPGGPGSSAIPFPSAPRSGGDDPPPPLPPAPGPELNPENIAETNPPKDVRPAPRISLPQQNNSNLPEPDPVPMGPAGGMSLRVPAATGVPSCEIVGNRVMNFALNDPDGRPWEFRNHHGRLVLLDFWGTWCPHCIAAMPGLRDLQRRYGAYGLEVVGIACEDGSGPEVVQDVQRVYTSKNLNYQVLLAENFRSSPLVKKFGIKQYPTMILLDENGQILARGEGAQQLPQIEATIKQRLARR